MVYELIKAEKFDIDKLIEYKENTIFEYADNLTHKETENIKKYVREQVPKQINNYKMILIDSKKIGCLLVKKHTDGVLLDEIYLEKDYRNQGIGTNIIKQVIDNNKIVYLWVYKSNKNAISLYKKLGFAILDDTESRYYMKYEK